MKKKKAKNTKWTSFMDMYSGGGTKEEPYEHIYIEAPEEEAKIVFYNRFGHNPERVSCTCCGQDYSIDESESLEQLTGFHRRCLYDRELNGYIEAPNEYSDTFFTLEEYSKLDYVLVIKASEIKEEEKEGDVPEEGYHWI